MPQLVSQPAWAQIWGLPFGSKGLLSEGYWGAGRCQKYNYRAELRILRVCDSTMEENAFESSRENGTCIKKKTRKKHLVTYM